VALTYKDRVLNPFATCKTKTMALSSLKKVLSLFSLATLAVLHSSFHFHVASLSVNEKAEAEAEANALLKWKATLQNDTHSPLPSWTLPKNATNSSIPCSWFGISCNKAGSVIRLNLTNSGLKGTFHEFPFSSLPNLASVDFAKNELFGTVLLKLVTSPHSYILICPLINYQGKSHHKLVI
jgi:hypothetical protein